MNRRFDLRTLGIMLGATVLGVAWAYFNYSSTAGERGEDQLVRLVWTIFATPFFLFIGWLVARRSEIWLAVFVCFCVYFFTPFVAARIESLLMTTQQAAHTGHHTYFSMVMVLHVMSGSALSIWRGISPPSQTETPQENTNAQEATKPTETMQQGYASEEV